MSGSESGEVTLAVIGTKLDHLTSLYTDLNGAVRDGLAARVPRTEWEQRNRSVDDRMNGLGREIGELRTEIRSRRVSWPAVGAVVVAGSALLLQLVQALGK